MSTHQLRVAYKDRVGTNVTASVAVNSSDLLGVTMGMPGFPTVYLSAGRRYTSTHKNLDNVGFHPHGKTYRIWGNCKRKYYELLKLARHSKSFDLEKYVREFFTLERLNTRYSDDQFEDLALAFSKMYQSHMRAISVLPAQQVAGQVDSSYDISKPLRTDIIVPPTPSREVESLLGGKDQATTFIKAWYVPFLSWLVAHLDERIDESLRLIEISTEESYHISRSYFQSVGSDQASDHLLHWCSETAKNPREVDGVWTFQLGADPQSTV